MKIKISYDMVFDRKATDIAHKLNDMGYDPIINDGDINFEGRTINIGAYEQIKQRDKRNIQVVNLKRCIINTSIEYIKQSDAILVYFPYNPPTIAPIVFTEIVISWFLNKPIFIYNNFNASLDCFEELHSFRVIILNEDLNKLKEGLAIIDIANETLTFKEERIKGLTKRTNRPKLKVK